MASLEQARHGLAFASGLAAEDNILRLLQPGQRVLLGNDAYGGTFRLISKVWGPLGYPWSAVDLTDLDALDGRLAGRRRDGVAGNTDESAAHVLRHRGDRRPWPTSTARSSWSTTRSPPRTCSSRSTLGADVVVHSATKYLGGHSDVVGGFVAVDDDELAERLRFTQNAAGAIPSRSIATSCSAA